MWIAVFKGMAMRTALMFDTFVGRSKRICELHGEEGVLVVH